MKREANSRGTGTALVLLPLLLLTASTTRADQNVRLACVPRTFQVVPGEPMRLELTVEADSALPLRVHLPADPLLVLRAVEKPPVQRTREGVIVYRRVVIWQALEPGTVTMNDLSIETRGRKWRFPEISITVRDPGP
jgi:hypothetical protein